jgi:hypothetical protein
VCAAALPAQGVEQFAREHGRYPDLVVLHSNYWDIAQIVLFRWWEGWEPEYTALMLEWLARADKVAAYLQARRAAAPLVLLSKCPLCSGRGWYRKRLEAPSSDMAACMRLVMVVLLAPGNAVPWLAAVFGRSWHCPGGKWMRLYG